MLRSERLATGRVMRASAARSFEIFKKTPYGTGLQRVSRYVASDILEVASIPMLNKTLLDHARLQRDRLAAEGEVIAESMKTVKRNSHQDVIRSADKSIAVTGDLVGSKENPTSDIFELVNDGIIIRYDAGEACLNAKLTDKELAAHPTKGKRRATNHTSGTLWKYARQVGSAFSGVVTQPGRAHEKYCYADI
jgi:dihydroxyacid dehydratase/phosphogluconate dehydratase